ncbi:hypothetical protein PENTCL1PPCAC_19096, partial [Pristionchus entomophagus]
QIDLPMNLVLTLLATSILSCVCYAVAYIYYKRKWSNLSSQAYETKFIFLALFSFLSSLPLTIHQMIFTVASFVGVRVANDVALTLFELTPWLVDLKHFAVIYLAIIMNKRLRAKCIET